MIAPRSRRRRAAIALGVVLAGIALATLTPDDDPQWVRAFWCSTCDGGFDPLDVILNVFLFIPLGMALRSLGVSLRRALLVVVATTSAVEALQYFVIVGRTSTIADVVTNAAGGWIGFICLDVVAGWLRPSPRTARVLAWAAAVVWVANAVFTMFAFQPSMTDVQLFAQIAPDRGDFEQFRGTVTRPDVNGALVFAGQMPDGFTSKLWEGQPLELTAQVGQAPPVTRDALIFALVDGATDEIAALIESRVDLAYRVRIRANDFKLRSPAVVLSSVFAPGAADLPSVIVGTRDNYELSVRTEKRQATLNLTPSIGWTIWWWFAIPRGAVLLVVTALWLALPMGLIAFWSRIAALDGRGASRFLWAVGAVALAMLGAHVAVPMAFGARLGSWFDVASIVAGAIVGMAAGQRRVLRMARQ